MKMHENNVLNEQTQFKPHMLFEYITNTHNYELSNNSALSPKKERTVLLAAASNKLAK